MEPDYEQLPYGPGRRAPESDVLQCSRSDWNGCPIIHVVGEIDWATAPILKEALAPVMAGPAPTVILELSGVSFLDSSGLSALIRAHHLAKGRNGWVRIAGPRRSIRKILRMTDTERILEVYDTLESALLNDASPRRAGVDPPGTLGTAYGLDEWLWPGGPGGAPINLN